MALSVSKTSKGVDVSEEISTKPSDHVERVASEILNQDATFSRQGRNCYLLTDNEKTQFHEAFTFHSDKEAEKFFNTVINMTELRTGHVDIVCNTAPLVAE